jgi:hypothetical protein
MKILAFFPLLLAVQTQIAYDSNFQKMSGTNFGSNLAKQADDAVNFLSTFLNINLNYPSSTVHPRRSISSYKMHMVSPQSLCSN